MSSPGLEYSLTEDKDQSFDQKRSLAYGVLNYEIIDRLLNDIEGEVVENEVKIYDQQYIPDHRQFLSGEVEYPFNSDVLIKYANYPNPIRPKDALKVEDTYILKTTGFVSGSASKFMSEIKVRIGLYNKGRFVNNEGTAEAEKVSVERDMKREDEFLKREDIDSPVPTRGERRQVNTLEDIIIHFQGYEFDIAKVVSTQDSSKVTVEIRIKNGSAVVQLWTPLKLGGKDFSASDFDRLKESIVNKMKERKQVSKAKQGSISK